MTRETHLFSELRIVHLNSLRCHEHLADARMQSLTAVLMEHDVLKDSLAVLPLNDGGGEYVVIDGANRTQAL